MEMQAAEIQAREPLRKGDGFRQHGVVDAELVFGESRGDVGVGVGSHVGVDAYADGSAAAGGKRQFADHHHLGGGFHVEAAYPGVEAELNLVVPLANACEHDGFRPETGCKCGADLPSADAVRPQAGIGDDAQDVRVGISLHGVVDLPRGTVGNLPFHLFDGLLQQGGVVEVERSPSVLEQSERIIPLNHC